MERRRGGRADLEREDHARRALAGDATKLAMFEAGIKQIAAAPPASEQGATTQPPGATAPAGQEQMIRGMVERLAERLKRDCSDLDGWLRLVRAYTVLGDRDRALSALADARRALGQDADKLRRLDELSKELKLEG